MDGENILLHRRRDKNGYPTAYAAVVTETELPHVVCHSPTGFEWGYGGSGPADLALSILHYWYGPKIADKYHQRFKEVFISHVDHSGGVILKSTVNEWLSQCQKEK